MRVRYLGFAGLLLLGCTGKSRLLTESKQLGGLLEVKVDVDPPAKGTLLFKGIPAFEKLGPVPVTLGKTLTLDVPLAGVPKGKNNVKLEFAGEGRGLAKKVAASGTLSFDCVPSTPGLRLVAVPKPGVSDIPCRGSLCEGKRIPFGADAKISVDLTECDGCDVDVGGQKISVRGAHAVSSIDLTNAIANAPGTPIDGISDMSIPFKITYDGATSDVQFQSLASMLAGALFRRIASGPVVLPGDAPAGPKKSAVIVRKDAGYGIVRTVGTAAKVRDYDLIGLVTPIESSLGSCGVYTKSDSKTKVVVDHKGVTYDVTMYDRRTAKNLGRKSFPPDNRDCGDKLTGDVKVIVALPAETAMDAWARSFLK